MKLLFVFCLIAVVAAAPAPASNVNYSPKEPSIQVYESESDGQGNYRYAFEQTDGTKSAQSGQIKDDVLNVEGSFTWVGPDGVVYVVKYTANEEGYKPEIEQGPGGGVPPGVLASLLGG